VSRQITAGTLLVAPERSAARKVVRAGSANRRSVDDWLRDHLNAIVLVVLAAGFALRVAVAARSYLNPDEALHYELIHQQSLSLSYQASLTNAHPPLTFVILYFWQFLGRSELMLRMPSILAGVAFCWFLYKWVGLLFGRAASLAALVLAAFCPALIALSAQVREYAFLLLGMGGALYSLERALEARSAGKMAYFTAFLYVAILSHYSAAFFALAVGIYVLTRTIKSRRRWKVVGTWIVGQCGALAIYVFLYVTHVSKIEKSEMDLWSSPHEESFFHLGHDSILEFTVRQTSAIFRFLFEADYLHQALLLLFITTVALLLTTRLLSRNRALHTWPFGLLLLLPFVAVWIAALAGIYPYSGSRHTVLLAPFVFAGVSVSLAKLFGRKLWAAPMIAALIAVAAYTSGLTFEPYMTKENQAKPLMASAMNHIRQSVSRSDHIMVDMQSSALIAYYLCDPAETIQIEPYRREFNPFTCNGYSVVSTNDRAWKLTPENFVSRFVEMATAFQWRPGDQVWVFQGGWGTNLDVNLPWFVKKYSCLNAKTFGANITVIPFVVGGDLSPDLPQGSPHLSQLNRCVNDPVPSGNAGSTGDSDSGTHACGTSTVKDCDRSNNN